MLILPQTAVRIPDTGHAKPVSKKPIHNYGGCPMRIVVLIVVLIYIISPLDFVPGPIDDVVVGVLGVAYQILRDRKNKKQ